MDIMELLENFFKKNNHAVSISRLYKILKIKDSDKDTFLDALFELEKRGKIIYQDNMYIKVPNNSNLYHGKLQISNKGNLYIGINKSNRINIKNYRQYRLKKDDIIYVVKRESKGKETYKKYLEGDIIRVVTKETLLRDSYLSKGIIKKEYLKEKYYIQIENKKYYINKKNMKGAYPGDLVSIHLGTKGALDEVKVLNIIKRKSDTHIFKCIEHEGVKKWLPLGTTYFEVSSIPDEKIEDGSLVLATLKYKEGKYYLDIKEKIISKYNEATINSATENNFSLEFDKQIIKEAENIIFLSSITDSSKRKDLRNLVTVTIDSIHAKDLDDAISLEEKGGLYYLYVSIADVSSYVPFESALFNEAINRGTSVYPLNDVIPMFPKKISNEICSLNPQRDKLALTCMMKIDVNGNVLDFEIFNSIINSNYKMSYDSVNNLLLGKEYDYDYLPFYQLLFKMQKLSNIIQNKRIEKGSLFLQTSEYDFSMDEFSNPLSLEENEKGPAQSIIENFMIMANKTVADYAYYLELPFVYRNHEPPTNIGLDKLKSNLKHEKVLLNRLNSITNPNILKKVLLSILTNTTKEEATFISEIVLKSMTRAYYDNKNIGHYGLGLDRYATFTSPIRRAPDLLNHYALNAILNYDKGKGEILETLQKKLPNLCAHLTERQIAAENVEKETNYTMLKELSNNILIGRLSQVIQNCAFIKLEDSVMGLIHTSDRYAISLKKQCLIDRKEKKTYNIDDIILLRICNDKNIASFIPLEIEGEDKKLIKRRR